MRAKRLQKYLVFSAVFHVFVFLFFVLGFDFSAPIPVIENTNKNDVISAVVLGDTPKSRILPNLPTPKIQQAEKEKPAPKEKNVPKPQVAEVKKDVIALKAIDKKKLAEQKALEEKKRREKLANDLLADIKKINDKQKKIKQKQVKSQFEKTLREQAEKSLRQHLLNEDIKLQSTESRQAQGIVNKYQALIIQAISERWIVPLQANRKLYCKLTIRTAPGGRVLDVQVTKSSGDPSLDSSARAAVLKASPLPVPPDPEAFETFRKFELKVRPENIMTSDGGLSG